MGEEISRILNSESTDEEKVLQSCDLEGVAAYIKSDSCRRVFVMVGAGISTSAGIPDFRSPDTGLYSNLARLKLPYPEAVFDIGYFHQNPVPFYTLAKELYPGRFRPSITHSFLNLLHLKSRLSMCFTQNIDTLERMAGVPEDKIVEAHGSFATQRCVNCRTPYDDEKMKEKVRAGEVPRCEDCDGLVKPDIVFFGESLPPQFGRSVGSLATADMLIVIGTSLTVHPFASLVRFVPKNCPRLLINLERVGDFSRKNDVVCLGDCDDVVKQLCAELGWSNELDELWAQTEGKLAGLSKPLPPLPPAGSAKDEVEKIAEEIEKKLSLSPEPKKDEGPSGLDRRDPEVTASADQEQTKSTGNARGVTASADQGKIESVDGAHGATAPVVDLERAEPTDGDVDQERTKPIDEAHETKADEEKGSPSESPDGKL